MKIKLLAAALLLGTAGFAHAADAVVEEVVVDVAPVFIWTGGYIGLQGGYSWLDPVQQFVGSINLVGEPDANGWTLGGQAGYRYQFDSGIVAGVEADLFGYFDADGLAPIGGSINNAAFEANYGGSVRGQVGYAFDRFLPYVTGGLAFVDIEGGTTPGGSTTVAPGASYDDTRIGWTIGAGLAYAVTDNWIVNADYRYSDYGDETYDTPAVAGGTADTSLDLTEQALKLGISYKF